MDSKTWIYCSPFQSSILQKKNKKNKKQKNKQMQFSFVLFYIFFLLFSSEYCLMMTLRVLQTVFNVFWEGRGWGGGAER